MKTVFFLLFATMLSHAMLMGQTNGVGINVAIPKALLHVKNGNVLFEGPGDVIPNPGPTPVTGTGVRMMWYTDKAAFRVGRALNSGWDDPEIGKYSFASGNGVKATGDYAIALGNQSTASGIGSFAVGDNSLASGSSSFALGNGAKATGTKSVSIGDFSTAEGFSCLAIGHSSRANGAGSQALGYNALATGNYSLSIGLNAQAKAELSSAIGIGTKARGVYAISLGTGTQANGYASIVIGAYNDTIVSAESSMSENTPLFILGNGTYENVRSNAIVVKYNGNTGIGTNFPLHRLHVKVDDSNQQIARFSGQGGYGEIIVDNGTNIVDFGVWEEWGYTGTKTATDFHIRTASDIRMTFKHATGNVGIGTITPTHKLEVNGTASKPGGGSWVAASDLRLKQNVLDYTDGLSSLLKIRPVSFQYNAASGFDTDKQFIGIIAQELQTVAPYMVSTSVKTTEESTSDYLEVDNSAMVYMLINAVKEQQAMISELQAEVQLLKKNTN